MIILVRLHMHLYSNIINYFFQFGSRSRIFSLSLEGYFVQKSQWVIFKFSPSRMNTLYPLLFPTFASDLYLY